MPTHTPSRYPGNPCQTRTPRFTVYSCFYNGRRDGGGRAHEALLLDDRWWRLGAHSQRETRSFVKVNPWRVLINSKVQNKTEELHVRVFICAVSTPALRGRHVKGSGKVWPVKEIQRSSEVLNFFKLFQKLKLTHYIITSSTLIKYWGVLVFFSPKNISGALHQNRVAAFS